MTRVYRTAAAFKQALEQRWLRPTSSPIDIAAPSDGRSLRHTTANASLGGQINPLCDDFELGHVGRPR